MLTRERQPSSSENDSSEATELLRVLRRDPRNVTALKRLGFVALRRGAVERAAQLFLRALNEAPGDGASCKGLGICHLSSRDFGRAAQCFERALRIDPDDADAWLYLGNVRRRQYDHAAAAECYRAVLRLSPDNAEALFRLGSALRWLNRPDEAASRLVEALRGRPRHAATVIELGLARKAEGRLDDALWCFRGVLEARPDDVFARAAEASVMAKMATNRGEAPPKGAKRVALHMNRTFHYAIMRPIFDALAGRHHALITDDAPDIVAFDPDVVIVADAQARRLRPLVPRAKFVFTHHGLISKNQNLTSAAFSDYSCVTGEAMRDIAIARSGFTPDKVWMTGYPQMDALFAPNTEPPPIDLPAGRKTVLFGPAYNRHLSAAPMLGERLVELIRGRRDDVSIIIKPHPLTSESGGPWINWWRKMAAEDEHVHLVESAAADVMPYLRAADLLITDACSLTFEFLPLDRPIILLANPEREKDPRYDPDGIEWRWRDMGEDLSDVEELPGAVDRVLEDPGRFAARRAHYNRLLFGDLADGKSAERIVEHISALELDRPGTPDK